MSCRDTLNELYDEEEWGMSYCAYNDGKHLSGLDLARRALDFWLNHALSNFIFPGGTLDISGWVNSQLITMRIHNNFGA